MKKYVWPVRVYYEDTDVGGVVYHAQYLCFLERCRTEWLRSIGVEQDALRQQHNTLFMICNIDIAYLSPAKFNDELDVTCVISNLSRVSFDFEQKIYRRNAETGEKLELCRAMVKVVCVKADSFRPCAIPKIIKSEIQRDH